MKLHIGGLTFTVATNPGMPPESFAIVGAREVALWDSSGALQFLSREEYDRRARASHPKLPSRG